MPVVELAQTTDLVLPDHRQRFRGIRYCTWQRMGDGSGIGCRQVNFDDLAGRLQKQQGVESAEIREK
jgi:hypothetical protein